MIDVQSLKKGVDLRRYAGAYTHLRHASAEEDCGPCPKCGGEDRFHVKTAAFFCRQCHEKWGDAIEFAQWMGLAPDFRGAVAVLGGQPVPRTTPTRAEAAHSPVNAPMWEDPRWQGAACQERDDAIRRLASPKGEAARGELQRRGIRRETWEALGFGYALVWNPALRAEAPAIVMPWQKGGTVKALQYRFFGPNVNKAARFSQKKGSERTLFGCDQVRIAPALLLIEGEMNAASVWQVLKCLALLEHLDVLSFGTENNVTGDKVLQVVQRYRKVIVWADKADVAAKLSGKHRNVIPFFSGQDSDHKHDANDMLRAGQLDRAISNIIKWFVMDQNAARVAITEPDEAYIDYIGAAMASSADWYRPGLMAWMSVNAPGLHAEAERLGEAIDSLCGRDIERFKATVDGWLNCYQLAAERKEHVAESDS